MTGIASPAAEQPGPDDVVDDETGSDDDELPPIDDELGLRGNLFISLMNLRLASPGAGQELPVFAALPRAPPEAVEPEAEPEPVSPDDPRDVWL